MTDHILLLVLVGWLATFLLILAVVLLYVFWAWLHPDQPREVAGEGSRPRLAP